MFRNLCKVKYPNCLNLRNLRGKEWNYTRAYCQSTKLCWSCGATLSSSVEIICKKCSTVQEIPQQADYFSLFGIEKQHQLDLNNLTSKFRNLQSQIHPDKFSGKSADEQALSADWSSLINEAYKVLQGPLERGEYLLGLHGIILPEDNTIRDPEFLSEMMEKNEEVEDATTKEELTQILLELREEMTELSDAFSSRYQSGNFDNARNCLIKMKYLASIEKTIKEKLLRL